MKLKKKCKMSTGRLYHNSLLKMNQNPEGWVSKIVTQSIDLFLKKKVKCKCLPPPSDATPPNEI